MSNRTTPCGLSGLAHYWLRKRGEVRAVLPAIRRCVDLFLCGGCEAQLVGGTLRDLRVRGKKTHPL